MLLLLVNFVSNDVEAGDPSTAPASDPSTAANDSFSNDAHAADDVVDEPALAADFNIVGSPVRSATLNHYLHSGSVGFDVS
jgi:hypothetical protein